MRPVDLVVSNARVMQPGQNAITGADTAFAVQGGVVVDMGTNASIAAGYAPQKALDAAGKYVVPGFVNTHNHLFQVLAKGLGKGLLLWDWLNTTIMRMLPHLDEDAIYHAALAGCLASMRTGVTTTLDFNYVHTTPGLFGAVCQAFTDSGMRGYVGRNQYTSLYGGLGTAKPETVPEYFQSLARITSGMKDRSMLDAAIIVPIIIGVRELGCYYDGYLRDLRLCAEDLDIPYTMHLVETPDDDAYCTGSTGLSTVRFLEQQAFFGPRCVLAHCVCMCEDDYAIFKRWDVKVSYNPVSNMVLASGIAPVARMLEEGISVSIATDGSGSNDSLDMLECVKTASLLQKVALRDSRALPAQKVLEMATVGGANALCRGDLGAVEVGKKADFFFFNPSTLRAAPVADAMSSLVYTGGESSVDTVVVNGRVLMEKGAFTHVEEGAVVENLEKAAARIRQKSGIQV